MSWLDSRFHLTSSFFSSSDVSSSQLLEGSTSSASKNINTPDRVAVGMALAELFLPGTTLKQRRQTLEHQRHVLLTATAIGALVEQALEARYTNPALASVLLDHADLLDNARRDGISAAWKTFLTRVTQGYEMPPAERQLFETQDRWMLMLQTDSRIQRRFLEEHLELLSYGSLSLFLVRFLQVSQEQRMKLSLIQQSQLHQIWNMLFYARLLGGDRQAVRDAYVNQFGGFILDVPDWLETVIQRDEALRKSGRRDQTARLRIALWQNAFERARHEAADVEHEMQAAICVSLQQAYNEVQGMDKAQMQQQEITYLTGALILYREELYPYPWALAQNALGSTYHECLQGDSGENLEAAIACFQAALRVFTEQEYPVQWALTQNYLGLAYRDYRRGSREENQEQALLFYQAALRVLTEEETPRDWAMVQSNLGMLYLERLHDYKALNQARAIEHFQTALRLFTERDHPVEWATALNNLGNVLSEFSRGNPVENKQQAIKCYQMALRVRTERDFPVEWATTQNNLGGVYSKQTGDNAPEDQERAIVCFQASLRVFTEASFPVEWARTQNNLGHIYSKRQQGNQVEHREQAIKYYQAALRVYTREAFPYFHRSVALNLASCAAEQHLWELMRSASSSARAAEDDLIALAAGAKETDTILRGANQATIYETFALTRLGRYAEAIEVLEHGRVRGLASARLLHGADPQRISNPALREHYLTLRTALVQAQAVVQEASTNQLIAEERLARTAMLRQVRNNFDTSVAAIRAAGDPADFFYDNFSSETLLRILDEKPAEYALIYLLATPWGGLALGTFGANATHGTAPRFAALNIPLLTLDTLHREELFRDRESYLKMVFNRHLPVFELGQCLDWLAEAALRPLAAWLQQEGITSMTLIPCGILAAFPLLTIPLVVVDDEPITLTDYCVASIAPSARVLLDSIGLQEQRSGVAALGNPYPTPQKLPWGEAEVLTVAHLGGNPSRIAIQYDADRASLLDMLRTALVVDISSHGIAADDYLQSHLLLANGESLTLADALNDKITDIHGLRLLILSACQTALFGLESVPDEVRSLATGMLQAGARAVLAALWPVDDRATYLLIVRFAQEWFPHMESEPPAAALARAQHWLRSITNRELQNWQAIEPFPTIITAVHNQPETTGVALTRDAAFTPGRAMFQFKAEKQDTLVFGLRYSVQDAEQILQEVSQRWVQEGDPENRPYADPFYWAGFQLYGW